MVKYLSSSFYPARSRTSNITAWILQIFLAIGFLAAAGAKFASVPMMVTDFETIGLGQGFRYVTALVEIIGAVALLAPRVTALGGILMAVTMAVATMAHLFRLHTTPAPALLLLALSLFVAFLRRDQILRLFGAQH